VKVFVGLRAVRVAIEALLPWNLKPILDARRKRQESASQIGSP
jgi:hypothetical protein